MNDPKQLTTESGAPVADNQNSLTAGPRGPLLVQDWQLFGSGLAKQLGIEPSKAIAA
ncbi:hypothetical protein [Candidatus Binatus sp.]|uniref:hypothetical protein n=1 Tax=Candidatus Binatus sp. TaxID=2811406 RepID=UPI003BAE3543